MTNSASQTGSPQSHRHAASEQRSWAIGLMGALALSGWGAFAYGLAMQQRLSGEMAELKASQGQLFAERDRAKAEAGDLRASREQLIAVYDKNREQLAAAQKDVAMLRSRLGGPQAGPSETASVESKKPPTSAGTRAGAPPPIPPFLKQFMRPPFGMPSRF